MKKINQQMSHITAKRILGKGQLDQEHWKKIKEAIAAEVKRFESALTPEYEAILAPAMHYSAGSWRCKLAAINVRLLGHVSSPTN